MKTILHKSAIFTVILGVILFAAGCGLSGSTYQSEGGVVQIEFQSGGKAVTSMGPLKMNCTYVEEGSTVAVTCEGDKTIFTIKGDQLIPPNGGLIGPLTKKK
jgi:hypothetical protein